MTRTGAVLLGVVLGAVCATSAGAAERWKPLFDGATLSGWIPKIVGSPAGENARDTFVVKDGAITVSYAGYDRFENRFGHLFYKTPFRAYRLKLKYKVLEPPLPMSSSITNHLPTRRAAARDCG